MTDETAMRQYLDNLTKPKGSLGKLEDLATRLAVVQGHVPPKPGKKAVFVIAGDHGVTEEGVSLFPKEVTAQMAVNFLAGGAAINSLARGCGFDVFAVDAGIEGDIAIGDLPAHESGSEGPLGKSPGLIRAKAARGTKNFARENAMSAEVVEACLANGRALALRAAESGYRFVAIGDMGIGNTTAAAAVLVAGGFAPELIVDRGTGIDDATLARKYRVVVDAVRERGPFAGPKDILAAVGGLEIATMTGLILGLKGRGIACLLDGFPVTSAAWMARMMDPEVCAYLFAGHLSKVKGHQPVLAALGLEPIVDFGMRLGEGTGAVIGGFMLELAAKFASRMATFETMGVARSFEDEQNY
jgi:nicotinate-nucleotide--dimethylbenzimidazole phosphoribosyltransferase